MHRFGAIQIGLSTLPRGDEKMKTQTIKEIERLLKELDTSFWGSITLRIQRGEVVNVVKEQSIKIDALAQDVQQK